jgi:hypothetical protein
MNKTIYKYNNLLQDACNVYVYEIKNPFKIKYNIIL